MRRFCDAWQFLVGGVAMKRHTPGPWGLRGVQIRADGGRGQHVATYQVSRDDGELIAAAPELLELLEQALPHVGCAALAVESTHPVRSLYVAIAELLRRFDR